MITPEAEQANKTAKREEKKKFLIEIITASARYERLLANKDFKDVLLDMQNVSKMHEDEIKVYLQMYSLSSSFFKKMRLAEVMSQHQLRKNQIDEAMRYPHNIVAKAVEAREELDAIKAQELKESPNA